MVIYKAILAQILQMRNYFILIYLFICTICAYTQNIDSLLQLSKTDTSLVTSFSLVIEKSNGNKAKREAIQSLFNDANDIANKYNYSFGKANLYNKYANYLKSINEYDESIKYQLQAIDLCRKNNYELLLAKCLNNLGNINNNRGNYNEALKCYLESLSIFEKSHLDKQISSVLMSIGNVYADQGNSDVAISYYLKSLETKRKLKDDKGIMNNLVNIGGAYYDKKDYTKCLAFFKQALAQAQLLKDIEVEAVCLSNISEVYGKQDKYQEALKYALQAEKIKLIINDENSLALTYVTLGDIYLCLKQGEMAKINYEKAMTIGKKLKSHEIISLTFDALSEMSKENMDFETALQLKDSAEASKDSMFSLAKMKEIGELEAKYQNEKKNLEISNKEHEINKKNTWIGILIAIFIISIVLVYLMYSRYQLKQKQLLDDLLLKEQEKKHKAIFEAEEKERIRIARDLHDGVGQLLSAAKMNLTVMQQEISHTQSNTHLLNAMNILDESVKEVRTVSHNMVPNALIKQGLAGAVREFIHRIGGNIKIELEVVGFNNRLNSTTETVLFRVLQELVNNIIKHANANKIVIQLIEHETYISMILEDNGVGFDTKKIEQFTGIGLKNIITRISYINGTVDFDSTIGRGTTVIIEVPK